MSLRPIDDEELLRNSDLLIKNAKRLGSRKHLYNGYHLKASYYYTTLNSTSLQQFTDSLMQAHDIKKEAPSLFSYLYKSLSRIYSLQNQFGLSIQMAMTLYAESEAPGDQDLIYNAETGEMEVPLKVKNRINALDCLGWTYYYMDEYEKALKYKEECVSIIKHYPHEMAEELLYAEYGLMMASYGNADKELTLHNIKMFENDVVKYGENSNMRSVYLCGIEDEYVDLYCSMNNMSQAKNHYDRYCNLMDTCEAAQEYRDNFYRLSAVYYSKIGNGDRAMLYADSAISMFHEERIREIEAESMVIKMQAAHLAKRDSLVYDIAMQLFALNDTIFHDRYNSAVEEMTATIGRDKLNIDQQRIATERRIAIVIAFIVLLVCIAIIAFISQRHEKEKQKDLNDQKLYLEKEVKRQTEEISYKQDRITSSIRYAQNIQTAMLPNMSTLGQGLIDGAFAIYKPCKIVSGDFYWAKQIGKELLVIAANSEEQGVYGAFFSMIGSTMLNEICSKDITKSPNKILTELGNRLSQTLNKSGNMISYRMKANVVYLNMETMKMKISLASNSIILFRDGQFTIWENANDSLGEINSEAVYITREISIRKGDLIYIGADGLTEQPGGANGDTLGIDRLKNILANVAIMDIHKQEDALCRELAWWQGEEPQHNDITFIGIKI